MRPGGQGAGRHQPGAQAARQQRVRLDGRALHAPGAASQARVLPCPAGAAAANTWPPRSGHSGAVTHPQCPLQRALHAVSCQPLQAVHTAAQLAHECICIDAHAVNAVRIDLH
jgi:hypothetical protein